MIKIAGMTFANPVLAASGTFGFGEELAAFTDVSRLGGICLKGLTLQPRQGNPPVRIAETASGILNSVGLQNPGIDVFIREILPRIRHFKTNLIANIAGGTVEEYVEICRLLEETDIDAIELNLSCPNVKHGCLAFGSDPSMVELVTSAARAVTSKPLFVKLTPNVTDITLPAKAAENGGADAVSLINTLLSMAIDVKTRRPILANVTGGLSGPAVKPVALRMVYDVSKVVDIPVIGMGGIASGEDAASFLLAGATAVQVGTATLCNPNACCEIIDALSLYAESQGLASPAALTGQLIV